MILRTLKKKIGFTLVEVIVALAIFVVIAAFAFPIFLSSFQVNVGAQEKTQIQEVSQNYLEHVIYISKVSNNKVDLINALENDLSFGEARYDETLDSIILETEKYVLEIAFDGDSNFIKIQGLSLPSKQTFETVEWLNYGS